MGKLRNIASRLGEVGSPIPHNFILAEVLHSLGPDCDAECRSIRTVGRVNDWGYIENVLRERYEELCTKGGGRNKRPTVNQALVARVPSHGYRGSGGGKGNRGKAKSRKKASGASGSGSGGAKGSRSMPRAEKGRCSRCHKTGHFTHQCPEAQCSRCKKWGHVSGACPEQDSS
ncbi:unnamed protein product, partial [Discosporangium mesarthrocarpum]